MNAVLAVLLAGCLVLVQCLIGGTRLVFGFKAYAVAAVAGVLSVLWINRKSMKPTISCLVTGLLLAAYVFWRAWESPVPYLARSDAFMIGGTFVVYLLTVLYVHESRPRLFIVAALLVVAAIHILVGLLQFRGHDGFMLFGFLRGDDTPRASGMLICPNHLAGYLESMGLIALSLAMWSRYRFAAKLFLGYLALFCYLGLILTGSRGGYLSAVVSLVIFAGLSVWIVGIYRGRNLNAFLVGTFVAGILILSGTVYAMMHNVFIKERLHRLTQSSQDARVYNWQAAVDQARLAPVIGTGAGTHLFLGRFFRKPMLQVDPVHAHCDYLEMLAEYGVVGLLLAFLFLLTHLRNGLLAIREITYRRLCNALVSPRSDSLALTLGATASAIALATHSVVDFNMHIPGNALLFAFFFGILCNPGIDRSPVGRVWTSALFLLRGSLATASVIVLVAVVSRYKGESLSEQARVALREQQYSECIDLAGTAVKADPSNPNPFFYRAEARRLQALHLQILPLRLALFERATEDYNQSLKLFPQDINALVRLGQALDGAHRFNEAESAYRQALSWDPNSGILYAYYAAHLELIDQKEGARKCIGISRQLGTKDPELVGMAEIQTIRKNDGEKKAEQEVKEQEVTPKPAT